MNLNLKWQMLKSLIYFLFLTTIHLLTCTYPLKVENGSSTRDDSTYNEF